MGAVKALKLFDVLLQPLISVIVAGNLQLETMADRQSRRSIIDVRRKKTTSVVYYTVLRMM